jgi:hypothetical protein
MKKQVWFTIIFLLGIGLLSVSAQGNSENGARTARYSGQFQYWQPVYCNGFVDYLTGVTTFSGIEHYDKDGVIAFQNFTNRGTAISDNTGEVFEVIEMDKQFPEDTFVTWTFNLKGNQGSHYIGSMTWEWTSNVMTVEKFVCVQNKGKSK